MRHWGEYNSSICWARLDGACQVLRAMKPLWRDSFEPRKEPPLLMYKILVREYVRERESEITIHGKQKGI